ncbi:MAG: SGNH/GDSL hydrolase family protein [Acidobacteria bacterium]|nr:SGNH/GDSL hydrolase family protein [Acidobacteriota bacterium]
MPRGRSRLRRILFAATAVLLGLAAVEVGLRLAGYRPLPTRPATRNSEILYQYTKFRSSTSLTWELTPGWSGREGGALVVINDDGLRERDLPREKPAGTRRILCLGDSVTFGHWVTAEQAFPRQLERVLSPRVDGRLEVINAGVPGYSPFQEFRWLEDEGWSYQPDLIIVGFVLNDVVERYLTMAAYGGAGTILGVDTTVTMGPLARLLRRTSFHRFVVGLMQGQARRREVYSVRQLFAEPLSPEIAEAWDRSEDELAEIVASARRHDVPVWLAIFPFRFQVAEDLPPRPQDRLARWAAAQGVQVVDLLPVAVRLGARAGFLDHDHPTPAGHEAAARALAEALLAARPPALFTPLPQEASRVP